MIRVAIADDSPFTCNLLASYIQQGGDCQVIGLAHDAQATVDLVREQAPDVLTLDLQMPGTDGLDLLRQLTTERTSVLVISGVTRQAAATTLRALELGAVDFILKYTPGAPVSPASLKREIVTKVKMAAEAPRVLPGIASAAPRPIERPRVFEPVRLPVRRPAALAATQGAGVVVIGASTGGPKAIGEVLMQLPADFATPCVIVQHLPSAFTAPFAAQLGRRAHLAVAEATAGDRLEPGRALVAPGAHHLVLKPDGRIQLAPATDRDPYRPSIDVTLISAAECYGASAVAVLMTGMGNDGAEGAKRIRTAGGEVYVQDPATCVVPSIPERTLKHAGADHVARPEQIGQMLANRSRA